MIKGILWDNDGVLVDSEHLFYEVNRDLFNEHGIALSAQDFFDWFLTDNCGAWHLLAARGVGAAQIAQHRAERNRRYGERLATQGNLAIAGIEDVLDRFSTSLPMGVVTSASRAHFGILHRTLDFERHFRFVVTAEDYVNSKPSPEPYLLGLEKLGLRSEECVVVEDSPRGLMAARAANIRCIVLRGKLTRHHAFEGAWRVVDTARELGAALDELTAGK